MPQMDENERRQKLHTLYRALVEEWDAEEAYDRAQWNVSYYRKTKGNDKARQKKIEQARLKALEAQEKLVAAKMHLINDTDDLRQQLFISFLYHKDGNINGIWMPNRANRVADGIYLYKEEIRIKVDEYEADKALTEALEDDKES
jgi:hypothetical protein